MISDFLVLICSTVLLWWSSSQVIRYAVELSSLLKIKTFVLGFVVLSLATSLPELSVAVFSALYHTPGLSVGNIIGANFLDLTLILGFIVVVVGEIKLERKDEVDLLEIFAIASLVMLLIFARSQLTPAHGGVLIALYFIAIFHIYSRDRLKIILTEEQREARAELRVEGVFTGKAGTLFKMFCSILVLLLSSRLVITSGVSVAVAFGIPVAVVGATIVALGTCLPELSLEFHAIRRKEYALALGDLFGSALTNTTLVLGLLSVLSPSHVDVSLLAYILPFLFAALLIIWFSLLRYRKITRKIGFMLLLLYSSFIVVEFLKIYFSG